MNTVLTSKITTTSSDDTGLLAERLAKALHGGEVIELVSDLGGGKTTFVKGLAKGMGSHDSVSSPTFTISNEYQAGSLTLHHFDFYRLSEAGIMSEELIEILADQRAVTVIEWATIVEHDLPTERLTITIRPTGETEREFTFSYPPALAYLLEGVA